MQLEGVIMPNIHLSLLNQTHHEQIETTAKALASTLRLKMIKQLHEKPMTIAEIAKKNDITNSTAIFHLNLMLEAKIVRMQYLPSKKGSAQVFFLNVPSQISFYREVDQPKTPNFETFEQSIEVGMYTDSDCKWVGMATSNDFFHRNHPFDSQRKNANLIWSFGGGVTYSFSNLPLKNVEINKLEFSFEICSETTCFRNDWKSDIFIGVNNVEIAHYLSPGDFGGTRGKYNPDWWPENMTQFGNLICVSITESATFLNNVQVSNRTLSDLNLDSSDKILLSIYNKKDSTYYGGFNIFGKNSGNFDQDIVMTVHFKKV